MRGGRQALTAAALLVVGGLVLARKGKASVGGARWKGGGTGPVTRDDTPSSAQSARTIQGAEMVVTPQATAPVQGTRSRMRRARGWWAHRRPARVALARWLSPYLRLGAELSVALIAAFLTLGFAEGYSMEAMTPFMAAAIVLGAGLLTLAVLLDGVGQPPLGGRGWLALGGVIVGLLVLIGVFQMLGWLADLFASQMADRT